MDSREAVHHGLALHSRSASKRKTVATCLCLFGSGLDYSPVPEQGGNTERRAPISQLTQDVHLCYSMSSQQRTMYEWPGLWAHVVRHHMALPHQAIFVDHQPIHAYRTTGVCFIRTDANLRPFAKAKAIRKTCRGIMYDGRRVHLL